VICIAAAFMGKRVLSCISSRLRNGAMGKPSYGKGKAQCPRMLDAAGILVIHTGIPRFRSGNLLFNVCGSSCWNIRER